MQIKPGQTWNVRHIGVVVVTGVFAMPATVTFRCLFSLRGEGGELGLGQFYAVSEPWSPVGNDDDV